MIHSSPAGHRACQVYTQHGKSSSVSTEITTVLSESATIRLSQEKETALYLNGQKTATLVSSPHEMKSLIVGYCLAEGLVADASRIDEVRLDEKSGNAYVTTKVNPDLPEVSETSEAVKASEIFEASKISMPEAAEVPEVPEVPKVSEIAEIPKAPGISKTPNTSLHQDPVLTLSAAEVCSYGPLLDSLSRIHHTTHGVHEGAIVKDGQVLLYAEDIGRHNVLDRLRGLAALQKVDLCDKVLVFSGRVPQSVITKVRNMGLPIILSRAMSTLLALDIADEAGITVINALRPDSFKLFTHPERIK